MTRHQNHYDAPEPTKKRFYDKGYSAAAWSDLNHDLLFLVMMKLGIIDFVLFSGVCKSWRSLALSNWNIFMASKPPVSIQITDRPYKKECFLELQDFQGRKSKTLIPHSGGRTFLGLTRGYLVFFGMKTCDFWLVNPITRHELHFPDHPFSGNSQPTVLKAILVFFPSVVSESVLVVSKRYSASIWFSLSDSRSWTNVPSNTSFISDLHFFKEKIYVLTNSCLYVLQLYPKTECKLLQTKSFPRLCSWGEFVSTAANFYVMYYFSKDLFKLHKLDFEETKWVRCEKIEEYAAVNVKLEMGVDLRSKWYFPHDCLNVNLIHNKP